MPLVRSISGLRATVEDFLTEEIVINYVKAFSEILPAGSVVIGRDGRPSGEWIEKLAAETFASCGRTVRMLSVVPTPTVQLIVEDLDAVGGIAITASHNPAEWNGLKFIGADGVFLDAEMNRNLWDIFDNRKFSEAENRGSIIEVDNAVELHINKILELEYVSKFISEIKGLNLKVVVDAVNASGSVIVPSLLQKLGVDVIQLNCNGSGIFPHTPEPIPENLGQIGRAVLEHDADFGIAVDPDADRLVLIGKNGEPIGEELTISLAVESVLTYSKEDLKNVVVNLSTTRLVEDICVKYQSSIHRAPVGEINVVNKMRDTKALIGGEGSGGVILPKCHYGRDSLVGIALLLSLLARQKKTLNEIIAEFPNYYIVKSKQPFDGDLSETVKKIVSDFEDAQIDISDGIRIDYPKSWVQLRSSNTEPIIRIIAEALSLTEAKELISRIQSILNKS